MSVSISGDGALTGIDQGLNVVGVVTASGGFIGNVTGTASTATAAATAYGISGSPTLSGITSISTTNLTVNGNAYPTAGPLSNRNKIINGDMRIDQRNAGASVNVTSNVYTLDRWNCGGVNDGVLAMQRVSDGPSGFTNSLKVTVSTADSSLGATQYARVGQMIEGFNVADFAGGTASAATVVLSFWIKSSVTGTYGGHIASGDESRVYVFQYTVNSANTWEYKSVAVTLSTSGTWATGNTAGMRIFFSLGCGSSYINTANTWLTSYAQQASGNVNLIETSSATWQLTGVQLEQGTVATPFENRSYGDELARCQRYCCGSDTRGLSGAYHHFGVFTSDGTTSGMANISFPVTMRARPTTIRSSAANKFWGYGCTGFTNIVYDQGGLTSSAFNLSGGSGGQPAGATGRLLANNTTDAYILFEAEL